MITDRTLDRAWEAWCRVWDPKERDPKSFQFALKDKLDDDQFREAARLALSECKFFPTPYDIAKLAPPPKQAFNRAVTPEGFTELPSLETGLLRSRMRLYERWFEAVTKSPVVDPESDQPVGPVQPQSPWVRTAKRLIATQYVLCQEALKLRESYEEVNDGPKHGPAGQPGLFGPTGGTVEHVQQEENGPMGVRPDSGPSATCPPLDTGNEQNEPVGPAEEDGENTGTRVA